MADHTTEVAPSAVLSNRTLSPEAKAFAAALARILARVHRAPRPCQQVNNTHPRPGALPLVEDVSDNPV